MDGSLRDPSRPPRNVAVSMASGAVLGGFFAAVVTLSIAPGRAALASMDTAHSRIEVFLAGLCRDVSSIVPRGGALALTVLVMGVAVGRRRSPPTEARFLFTTFPVGLLVLCPLLWLVSSSAEEFRIQRGIDPTWFDLRIARTDPAFVSSSLHVLLYHRHVVPSVIALVTLGALGVGFRRLSRRRWRRPGGVDARVALVGFALTVALADGAALLPIDPQARLFRTLTDRSTVGQPFTTLFEPFGARPANVQLGLSSLIVHAKISSKDIPTGAAILGLPAPRILPPGACTPHPFARSFSFDGEERTPAAGGARAAPLLSALESLSATLFEGRNEAPIVLQVLLEGVRADDVHALNANAAPEIAPFLSRLYEGGANGFGGVLGARRVFQAGVRTAQALAAVTCGLGTLPFGIALGRDLGPLPLRCLPDVLKDAGFSTNFYYGARVSFDNMEAFLNLHGFSRVVGQWQLPRDLPAVYWGVTDQSLFDAVLSESHGWGAEPRYGIVMTVSNHMPFATPSDLPPSVRARVEAGLAKTRNLAQHDDLPRLLTLSYTDDAFRRFTEAVAASPLGRRTLIVGVGDHSTSDRFVWPRPDGSRADTLEAKSRIPFVVIVPEALLGATSNPARTREAISVANAELNRTVISENDLPTLLLSLLSRGANVARLPSASRWHTLGGALTSPWFSGPGGPEVALSGIDSSSELFSLDVNGKALGELVAAGPLDTAEDLFASCPPLQPIRSLLSAFLNDYASACRSPGIFRREDATKSVLPTPPPTRPRRP